MLTNEEVTELYNVAYEKSKLIKGWFSIDISKESFKRHLYISLRYHFVNRYGNLPTKFKQYRYTKKELRKYSHEPLARVFKNKTLDIFGCHLSQEAMMLDNILEKVTNEHFSKEDKAIFDIQSSVDNMSSYVKDIENINLEGEGVTKELAKIPKFIETGKWE